MDLIGKLGKCNGRILLELVYIVHCSVDRQALLFVNFNSYSFVKHKRNNLK